MSSVDYPALIALLSVPRPNGSAGERATAAALLEWLQRRQMPVQALPFIQRPFFFECLGLWLILSRTLLVLAVWFDWGWLAPVLALLGLLGGTLDMALHWPLVTWPGTRQGFNLVLNFPPQDAARREVVICAHYDSKTELLDHRQRMFFLRAIPAGLVLTALLGGIGWLEIDSIQRLIPWQSAVFDMPALTWAGVLLGLPLLGLAWGLGLNLASGRLLPPSLGTVDNGAACAVILGLADQLQTRTIRLNSTHVTLALFSGEEVNLQGSRAYVRSRKWPLPASALNLEALGQDGDYVLWEKDGSVFHLTPTSAWLNARASAAVTVVTGRPPRRVGPVISDGGSFLAAGIPAATLGTYDTRLVDAGFHRPSDNPARLVPARLLQAVAILRQLLLDIDQR